MSAAFSLPKTLKQLHSAIVAGRVSPGTRLPAERALAAHLGCSRSALRETLQSLRSAGRIESRRGSASVVVANHASPLQTLLEQSPRGRLELLTVRSALDALAAEGAATLASDRELATIRKHQHAFATAITQNNRVAMARSDTAFHLAIAAASHNKVLVEVVRSLRDALETSIKISSDKLLEQPHFAETIIAQHSDIVAAIGRRDTAAARQAAQRHTAEITQRLQSLTP